MKHQKYSIGMGPLLQTRGRHSLGGLVVQGKGKRDIKVSETNNVVQSGDLPLLSTPLSKENVALPWWSSG